MTGLCMPTISSEMLCGSVNLNMGLVMLMLEESSKYSNIAHQHNYACECVKVQVKWK